MLIRYYLDGTEFASRTRNIVPRKNELVRFNGDCYVINIVAWVEDEDREYVSIDITKE